MPLSRGDVYFALSWTRLQAGLSRVFHSALQDYVDDLRFTLSPQLSSQLSSSSGDAAGVYQRRRQRRQIVIQDLKITSKVSVYSFWSVVRVVLLAIHKNWNRSILGVVPLIYQETVGDLTVQIWFRFDIN